MRRPRLGRRGAIVLGGVLVTLGLLGGAFSAGVSVGQNRPRRLVIETAAGGEAAAGRDAATDEDDERSDGVETVDDGVMPDVVDLPKVEALAVLAESGIASADVKIAERPAAGPAGYVVEQSPAFGEALRPPIEITLSTATTVPELLGRTEAEAIAALEALGADVEIERLFVPGRPVGTVSATDPAPGAALPKLLRLTVVSTGSSLPLTELDPVESDCGSGEVAIAGTEYASGLSCSVYSNASGPSRVEYDTGRDFNELRATAGIEDSADDTMLRVRYVVLVDGRRAFEREVRFGEAVPISVDVTGALRVAIEVTAVGGDPERSSYTSAALGDPQLVGSPDAVQAYRDPKN